MTAPAESLMQQGLLQLVQHFELALIKGFEALGFFLHGFDARNNLGLPCNMSMGIGIEFSACSAWAVRHRDVLIKADACKVIPDENVESPCARTSGCERGCSPSTFLSPKTIGVERASRLAPSSENQ